ncbi:MAG: M23 family metallopeptidase [Eubacteriales bacterium]|nr:M23 family metallopeptidase [Eubacteriales bacterium]
MKKKGPVAWLRRNGYYLLLVLSVGAIGTAVAVGLSGGGGKPAPTSQLLATPTPIVVTPVPTDRIINADPTSAPTAAPTDKPISAEPTTIPKKTSVFIDPVANGTVVGDFSVDAPVYLSTLDQWAIHNGLDVAAAEGADVYAAADGTVTEVRHDVMWGNVIRITHADGLVSEYAGLADIRVQEGEKVVSGTVIGTVGQTAIREAALGAHLHFAALVNGSYVDPSPYLPGGAK